MLTGRRCSKMPDPFFVELAYDTEANEVEFCFAFEAGGRMTGCRTTPRL